MANNFVDNRDRWLLLAKGEFDYSILFIKSWLSFNAWYCNTYPGFNNVDSAILKEMKVDNNVFRARIIAHLNGNDETSISFRKHLVEMNKRLEICNVPSVTRKISLNDICFRENPIKTFTKTHNNVVYKIEWVQPVPPQDIRVKGIVLKNALNIFPYQHRKYDLEHFESDSQYLSLSTVGKQMIKQCFIAVNPNRKESLIAARRRDALPTMTELLLINDPELISQAILEILYRLRCVLFHGEIQPTKDNLEIYEPAYYILRILLKSLY